jgi:hypothetical protein
MEDMVINASLVSKSLISEESNLRCASMEKSSKKLLKERPVFVRRLIMSVTSVSLEISTEMVSVNLR